MVRTIRLYDEPNAGGILRRAMPDGVLQILGVDPCAAHEHAVTRLDGLSGEQFAGATRGASLGGDLHARPVQREEAAQRDLVDVPLRARRAPEQRDAARDARRARGGEVRRGQRAQRCAHERRQQRVREARARRQRDAAQVEARQKRDQRRHRRRRGERAQTRRRRPVAQARSRRRPQGGGPAAGQEGGRHCGGMRGWSVACLEAAALAFGKGAGLVLVRLTRHSTVQNNTVLLLETNFMARR